MDIKILKDNDWLQLRKITAPDKGVDGYIYSHEIRCEGHIVAILPFKFNQDGSSEFLIREEVTPCWSLNKELSSITGGFEKDKHENVLSTVVEELKEEAGYDAAEDELISLGIIRGTKSTDTFYHLFGVDVTNKEQGDILGDGSELEAQASNKWVKEIPTDTADPMVYVLFYKLKEYFKTK